MLKPADPGPDGPDPSEEKPIGELVHQLIEDGKAYAQAEIDVVRAIASEKAERAKLPAILFAGAFLFLQAGIVVFGMTIYLTLVRWFGPLASGLIATVLCLGIAGGLAWYGARRLKEEQ